MYLLWRYIRNPTTAEAIATPRGTPKPMPILEEELRADDTAADSEARLFEEAAAVELAEEELADLLCVPLDGVVLSLAVNAVGDDVVVGLEFGVIELPGTALVIYKAEVVIAISPAADATELAFCVAELAAARAAAVG